MLTSRDLPLLKDFLIICESGSLTRAAARLGTVQSALTQKVQRLEEALGTPLLVRHSRGVTPNEQGQVLQNYARRILDLLEQANQDVAGWFENPSGTISIGLPPSVSMVLARPLIESLQESLPRVRLTVAEAFSGYLWNWLEQDEVDFTVVFDKAETDRIAVHPLLEEELFLISAASLRDRLPRAVTIADIARLPLILPSPRHGLRTDVEAVAAQRGLALNIRLQIDSGYHLIRQVLEGRGYGVLARSSVFPELEAGRLIAIPIVEPRFLRTVYLAESKDRQELFLARIIRDRIIDLIRTLVENDRWPARFLPD